MSFWESIKKGATDHAKAQFLDVIEWLDDTNDTIVYRYPVFNQAIQDGGKLVVRPGQAAVFVNEGQLSEVFGPGTHELSTRTKALVSFFETIKYQFNYPYKGDIYFVSTKRFTDQKWGTATPFMFEDPKYGNVEVRAYGSYEYKITDPAIFLREIVGTDGLFKTEEINGALKRQLVDAFRANVKRLASSKGLGIAQLDSHFYEVKGEFQSGMSPTFEQKYGITLLDFTVEGLNLPDDLRALMNKRREMDMMGDMGRYTQFQAANAIGVAAANPGMGGTMMGAGVGLGMGQVVGQAMGQAMAPPPPPPPGASMFTYHGPEGQQQLSAQQVAQKVAANRTAAHNVWMQGWPGWKSWKEVPEIANLIPPEAPPPPGVSFHYAGPDGQAELGAAQIAQKVKANPAARHMVWRQGFDGWKEAASVPEIAALLSSGPPPLPGGGGGPPPPPPM